MAEEQKCPNCLTGKAQYDTLLDLWQCNHCFILWGDNVYDPTQDVATTYGASHKPEPVTRWELPAPRAVNPDNGYAYHDGEDY